MVGRGQAVAQETEGQVEMRHLLQYAINIGSSIILPGVYISTYTLSIICGHHQMWLNRGKKLYLLN